MSDIWYYSDGEKSVGPISLFDLTAILSIVSNAKDVLVWQNGFEHWKRAADVPELASFVIKPPPLPPLPPPLPPMPPALPQEPLIVPAITGSKESDLQGSQSHKIKQINKVFGYIVTAAVIATIAASVRLLSNSGSVGSFPNSASVISGKDRESFVAEGMKTCLKKQENDPETKALSFPKEAMVKYCSCYMNGLADSTMYGDLGSYLKGPSFPPALQKNINEAADSCQESLRKSLLGG